MNKLFLIASILSAIGTIGHAFFGEYYILRLIQNNNLPDTPIGDRYLIKKYLRGTWHFFTIDLLLTAIALSLMSFSYFVEHHIILARFISLHFIGYFGVFLILAINRLNVRTLP